MEIQQQEVIAQMVHQVEIQRLVEIVLMGLMELKVEIKRLGEIVLMVQIVL